MTEDLQRELDQLRKDIQREIDLRLEAEAEARETALAALRVKELDLGQLITWLISVGAAAVALYAIFHETSLK